MKKPLHGMKILDFTYLLPGPYGSMLLADMGAEIIKVENSTQQDMMRFVPPLVDNVSAVYAHVNRGKKSFTINLKREEAREIIYCLVKEYDIVIEQFRPGVMEKFGLGYNTLKKINTSLIYCSLTGYGQTGSYASRAGHDINYMALSGLDSYSGRTASGPTLSGLQVADIAGGSKNLVIGVQAAYIKRLNTGLGDYIDVSITDAAFAMTVFSSAAFLEGGKEPEAEAELLNGGALYDYYRTADGRYLSAGPIEPKFFNRFCDIIGCPELAEEGVGNSGVKKRIASVIETKTLEEWHALFSNTDACVEPVRTLEEAVKNAPFSEREMIVTVDSMKGSPLRQLGNPIKFESGHYFAETAGVSAGYHNYEILEQNGYSPDAIKALKENGVIG